MLGTLVTSKWPSEDTCVRLVEGNHGKSPYASLPASSIRAVLRMLGWILILLESQSDLQDP